MFTGIITDIGIITNIIGRDEKKISIQTDLDLSNVALGDSIACSGACMTVTRIDGKIFHVDVSPESLAKTTLDQWKIGTKINLEKALCAGDPLGGHQVTGHVDGLAKIVDLWQNDGCWFFDIQPPAPLMSFLAPKGSASIDGVSLTINAATDNIIKLCIIPHTFSHTIFKYYKIGDFVNLEIDVMARYIGHYLSHMQKNNIFSD